jgi:hypothetical protein
MTPVHTSILTPIFFSAEPSPGPQLCGTKPRLFRYFVPAQRKEAFT